MSRRENSLNDCRIVFVDEVFKIERPGEGGPVAEHPLRRELGSCPRLPPGGGGGLWRPARGDPGPRVQGRAGRPASTARTTRARPAACAPATCAAASRTPTSSCCATSATWPSTPTASARPSAACPRRTSGERRRGRRAGLAGARAVCRLASARGAVTGTGRGTVLSSGVARASRSLRGRSPCRQGAGGRGVAPPQSRPR